jgi:HEPN domain-containing protein
VRPEAEPWWRQAEADLATGRDVLATGHAYAASWFSQQATEKALKALYIERRGTLSPRTHDLVFLGGELSVPVAIESDLAHLDTIFDEVRYPDSLGGRAPVDEITDAEAALDLAAAERALEWVRFELKV